MSRIKYLGVVAAAVVLMMSCAPLRGAQVSIGVQVGPPPVCPYGYFDYAPYDCAPYGYYGPEWFPGGVFIGVGPWFHGQKNFRGHVDNHFDPHHGFHGNLPARGEHADAAHHPEHVQNFHGNAQRDGRGHEYHGH